MTNDDPFSALNVEPEYWQFIRAQLDRLTSRGLSVSPPSPHGPVDDKEIRFRIKKPKGVDGNSIPDTGVWMGFKASDDRESDAPALWLHTDNTDWVVLLHEYIPGPGPGDFRHIHGCLEDAITDILDYYFGDPGRMQVKWRAAGLG
jgi:hypothetical protein